MASPLVAYARQAQQQTSPLNQASSPAVQQPSASDLLEQAADRIRQQLEGVPDYAAAAAGFSQAPRGSLPGILGAGMTAKLDNRLANMTRPYEVLDAQSKARTDSAAAGDAELQHQLNMLNYEYLASTAQGFADDGSGGGIAGENPLGDVPLTDVGRENVRLLQARLDKALRFAGKSPAAWEAAVGIMGGLQKIVQEDPKAKLYFETRKKANEVGLELGKDLTLKITDAVEQSYDDALKELEAYAESPLMPNPNDPEAVDRWLQDRAFALLQSRYKDIARALEGQGRDPNEFLYGLIADVSRVAEPSAPAQQPVQQPQLQPGQAPAQTPAAPPSPAVGGAVPTASGPGGPSLPPAVGGAAPGEGQPFVRKPLTQGEKLDVQKNQIEQATAYNTLEQWSADLDRALQLNKDSIEGPTASGETFGRRLRVAGQNLFRSESVTDPKLNNSTEMGSILAGQTLQNLSTLIKGNPTEGERAYVERLGAIPQMTKGERERLLKRGQRLLEPRIKFQRMAAEAAASGTTIPAEAYGDWLIEEFGPTVGNAYRYGTILGE